MRKRLFNQQSEPRTREAQKTGRLSVKAKIMMALLALMLIPQGAWAQGDVDYMWYDTSTGKFVKSTVTSGNYTTLTGNSSASLADGTTYVVSGSETINARLDVSGTVNIILCDGATFTARKGITVSTGDVLNIYAQSEGTGKLIAYGFDDKKSQGTLYAAIGGAQSGSIHPSTPADYGVVNIYGGQITADASSIAGASGIGAFDYTKSCVTTIYGGNVDAMGGPNYTTATYGIASLKLGSGVDYYGSDSPNPATNPATSVSGPQSPLSTLTVSTLHRYMSTKEKVYDLTVGGKQVRRTNANDILFSGGTTPTASFNADTNTLVLNGLNTSNSIESGLDNLTIEIIDDNNITSGHIKSTNTTATLRIKKGADGSLKLNNTNGNSAVEGFASVDLEDVYLHASNCCKYVVNGTTRAYQYPETDTPYLSNVQDLEFTTTHYYPLWVGSQQVSEANNGIINFLGIGTASFEPSTSGINTLTLEGVSIDSSNGIESGLDNLTIALKGVNSINTNTAYHYYPIYSNVANASLTIKKDETATDCSLTLSSSSNSPQVVKGFKTVTYDGLAYDTTVGGGTTLDATDTYGAKLSFTTYPLTVAGTPVTSANKGDVLNNGKVSYSHDATNNTYTLKLNGATIAGGVVWSAGDDLTIELTGENSISNTSGHAISGTFTTSTPTVNFIAVGGTSGSSCKLTLTSGLGNYHTINGLNVNTSLSDLGEVDNATNRTRIISSAFDVNKAGSLASIAKATYSPTASLVPTTVTLVIGRTQIDLINGRDFDISDIKLDGNTVYDFNKAGNYLVTIEGKDNYIGTRSNIGYIVEPKSVVGLTVAVSGTYTYTGSAIKPTITVTDGTTDLVADTDYTISSYANNTNAANATDASAPTVTIKGKGNYDNNTTENVTFTISKADFKDVTIDAIDNQTYTGSAIQPAVSVKFNGISVNTSEYNVGYFDNTNVGTATVKATAAGTNFTAGTYKETTFKIDPAAAAITATDQTVIFNGAAQAYNNASGSGTLQVTYYNTAADRTAGTSGFTADPVNASTYYVRVTQNDANYTSSPVDVTFTINPLAATPDVVLTIPTSYVYDGTAKTPAVAVSVSGVALTTDDYSVAYTDNINAGRAAAKATVTLKRNYSGSKVETFDINPLTATLSWGNTTFVYNGTAQAPTATVTNLVGTDVCNVTVGGAETAAGSYTATATALDNTNYQLPASPTTTFTILDRTATIDFGDRTFKTYYDANETFIVPDGTTAYIVTGVSGNAVTIQKVSYIKAGVPVLLESTPGSTVAKNVSETFTGNLLKYAAAATPATEKHYLLYKNEFVRASGTISNKVYLDLAGYSGGARSLVIGDGATAIEGIVIDEEDGDAKWYDMQGRRINKPTKAGLYIKDGQKVVVKTRY